MYVSNMINLKDRFTPKWKFFKSHYPLTPKPMESRVKFCSPQNISGAFKHHSVKVNRDL